MKILKSWPLKDKFVLAVVDEIDDKVHQDQARKYLANEYPMLPSRFGLDDEDLNKLKSLKNNFRDKYELRLVVLKGKEIVGWTYGWQDSVESDSFFMGASLIVPEYRKLGLYSKMVAKVIELTKERGFQSLWSLHVMTNNPVIIAKLKLGFNIFGFEVNTRYGALVRLVYHHSEIKKKAMRFRAGAVNENEFHKALLK